MGNPHSKPDDRVRSISREVNSLRSSLRTSKRNISKTQKEHLVETLATHSSEVSSYHGKVRRKDLEGVLKNISETMEDVLKIEPVELDGGAVESDSFVNVPLSQRRSNSLGSLRPKGRSVPIASKSGVPTLRDIEAKVEELKSSVATAIANKDANLLRVYKKTLTVLAADLELTHVEKGTPAEKRKESVDKRVIVLFQKVSRALNTLKKDDSQQNQTKQMKKRIAMGELVDIELKLAENESLLDRMIKHQTSADFATIRNNIVENNQRLAKVDIIDNEVKQRVVLLSQKLTEAVKNLDQIMAKREFDSKFAKSIHNYERVMKNFNPKSNSRDTVDNLQALRHSLENLEEINEATKHRKRELLTNVNTSINKISELVPNDDEKIVEEIVEDNVILRKKVKSMDKEHTVIDQFIGYWNNVKSNFNVNSYSHLSLLRIDAVLEEMQESIQDIRVQIAKKCDLNMPSNLVRKRSQSVPRLSNARNSYGSTKSVDQLIKTKAKMYNLPEPQVQNRRFSKIEEIKMQVYYIKEKVEEGNDNKEILKTKLEQLRNNLQEYTSDPNQAVSNNASLVSNEIIELLHQIVLAEYQERYQHLSKKINTLEGNKNDNKNFEQLKTSLINLNADLQKFKIPIQYSYMNQEKNDLESQVSQTLDTLQIKEFNSKPLEDDYAKELNSKLQALNEKVKRFSGTYKGVLYNQLERELNKLLLDVGEKTENKSWAEDFAKETERLLKILEQRSSVAQSFRGSKLSEIQSEEQQNMTKIKRDLINIKREIDRTPDSNVDEFIGFQSRLDLVNFELSQINTKSNENLAKEKEICSNETETLKNVVDAKVALGQQPVVHWPKFEIEKQNYPKTDVNKEIEQFEKAFSNIKQKISITSYEEGGVKFAELADEIVLLKEKLEKYKFIRGTDLYQRQATLLTDMQYYCDALRKEADDIQHVQNIESKTEYLLGLLEHKNNVELLKRHLQELQQESHHYTLSSESELLKKRQAVVQTNIESIQNRLNNIDVQREAAKKLEEIEEILTALIKDVSSFVGLKSDSNYCRLRETAMRAIDELDTIFLEDDNIKTKKINLLKEAHEIVEKLDERALQTKIIVDIEEAIDNLYSTEENSQSTQAKIRELEARIANTKFVKELVHKKNACKQKLNILFNKTLLLNPTQVDHGQSRSVSQTFNFTTPNPFDEIEKELADIQSKLEDATSMDVLKSLDEGVQKIELKLSKLKISKGSTGYANYQKVTKKVGDVADLIEEKMQDHDKLSSVNAEVDEITGKMNTALTYDEINKLDERLNQLLVTLRKINNSSLKADIDGTVLRIMLCTNRISDYLKSVQSTKV